MANMDNTKIADVIHVDGVEYRAAVDHPTLYVSRGGDVIRVNRLHPKKCTFGGKPGKSVSLVVESCVNNKRMSSGLGAMVYDAWIQIRRSRQVKIKYKDGNPLNCSADNLDWLHREGEATFTQKLTERDVVEIRVANKGGVSQKSLARLYGVVESNISKIVNRKSWKHI
jgi:hypothetical protein